MPERGVAARGLLPDQRDMPSIRPCSAADEAVWLSLRTALWPQTDTSEHREETRRWLADSLRYGQFLAVDGDAALGFAEVSLRSEYVNGTRSSPVGFLEGLYVVPAARRSGIARELVAACEDWARARGCSEFASDTGLDNLTSQQMHRALGFLETERVVCFSKTI